MAAPINRDKVLLYTALTIGYLIHWIHDDLTYYPGQFVTSLVNNSWQVLFVVGLNGAFFELILPNVTSVKTFRALAVLSSILIYVAVYATALYAWRTLGSLLHLYAPFSVEGLSRAFQFAPGTFLVFAAVKLFFDYTQLKYEGQKVRLEKKQAELQFLKSQINPHFLFNTLNNIYSLSQHQPHLVSESVLRLSKILRYLLYEASHEFITIEKEVKIITDYLDLEKLRYSEVVTIDFRYNLQHPDETIPPLLLMPLVENAFKHGVSASRGTRFVEINCQVNGRTLHFVVRNSAGTVAEPDDQEDHIGLANLRRRLELLYKSYDLKTGVHNSVFTAELTIDLSSHA